MLRLDCLQHLPQVLRRMAYACGAHFTSDQDQAARVSAHGLDQVPEIVLGRARLRRLRQQVTQDADRCIPVEPADPHDILLERGRKRLARRENHPRSAGFAQPFA